MMKLCSTKGYGRQGELDGFDFPLIKGGCEHAQTFRLVENRASIREAGLPASIELPVAASASLPNHLESSPNQSRFSGSTPGSRKRANSTNSHRICSTAR